MYTDDVKTQEQAMCHLFVHFCLKDGQFLESEMDNVAAKLVEAGLHRYLNIKNEIIKYRSYKAEITDENAFVQYLIRLINPTNEMAFYSYCVELGLSDSILSAEEDQLLEKIAAALKIDKREQNTTRKLMIQRKVVETQKVF